MCNSCYYSNKTGCVVGGRRLNSGGHLPPAKRATAAHGFLPLVATAPSVAAPAQQRPRRRARCTVSPCPPPARQRAGDFRTVATATLQKSVDLLTREDPSAALRQSALALDIVACFEQHILDPAGGFQPFIPSSLDDLNDQLFATTAGPLSERKGAAALDAAQSMLLQELSARVAEGRRFELKTQTRATPSLPPPPPAAPALQQCWLLPTRLRPPAPRARCRHSQERRHTVVRPVGYRRQVRPRRALLQLQGTADVVREVARRAALGHRCCFLHRRVHEGRPQARPVRQLARQRARRDHCGTAVVTIAGHCHPGAHGPLCGGLDAQRPLDSVSLFKLRAGENGGHKRPCRQRPVHDDARLLVDAWARITHTDMPIEAAHGDRRQASTLLKTLRRSSAEYGRVGLFRFQIEEVSFAGLGRPREGAESGRIAWRIVAGAHSCCHTAALGRYLFVVR